MHICKTRFCKKVCDSRMMRGKYAADAIPALKEFYDMCISKEVSDARVFEDKNFSYPAEE